MIITDSIVARDDVKKCKKILQLSIAHLIGEAIGRITDNRSVSSLFAWNIGEIYESSCC